jgi:hypothetical protein
MSPVESYAEYDPGITKARKKAEAAAWRGDDLRSLFESAWRVLPEYSEKLDRIVQRAINIWDERERQENRYTRDIAVAAPRDLDPLQLTVLSGLARELESLSSPLQEWMHALSAILEEVEVGRAWRMELRLRLTDLESKYQTALSVMGQFSIPSPGRTK